MKSFQSSITVQLLKFASTQINAALFGDKEAEVLRLFYNARLKVRKECLPKFQIYADVCDGNLKDDWMRLMLRADDALDRLEKTGLIQKTTPVALTNTKVGTASDVYILTADGLEILQGWHPQLMVRFRAWIAVLPTWVTFIGAVCGGIAAAWKIIDLIMQATK